MLQSTPTSDRDLLKSVMKRTSSPSTTTKFKVPKATQSTVVSTSYIIKEIRNRYKLEDKLDMPDRIMNAIEHLSNTYPDVPIPMNILYFMCNGGQKLKGQATEDVMRFQRQVSMTRKKMVVKFSRSFRILAGTIVGYTTREQHATEALPAAKRRMLTAIQTAKALGDIVGDANSLNLPSDVKDETRKLLISIKHCDQNIKGLLGPAK